jgi:hypothetical protein
VESKSNELCAIVSAGLKQADESAMVLVVRATTARASLDELAGRSLDDEEWAQMGQRLVEFGNILNGWHRAKNDTLRLGNVDEYAG